MASEAPLPINEIIARIQATVAHRKGQTGAVQHKVDVESRADEDTLEQTLARAESVWQVGKHLPPMHNLQGWRRKLASPVGEAILRVAQVITRDQRTFNDAVNQSFRGVQRALRGLREKTAGQLASLSGRLSSMDERLTGLGEEHEGSTKEQSEALARLEAQLAEVASSVSHLAKRLTEAEERQQAVRTGVHAQERRLSMLLEEVRRRLPGPLDRAQLEALAAEANHLADLHYADFEWRFRGTAAERKERAREHLQTVRQAGAGTRERPIIDLGCGRGEWLELLGEEGLVARGVETNRGLLASCKERHLEVVDADCIAYLRTLAEGSVGAVTALHLVEHLPLPALLSLFDEIVRVLKPGGVAIFETPNPRNLQVGAHTFYMDPTHRNPIPEETLSFFAEARGLVRVTVKHLHAMDEVLRLPADGSPAIERLNDMLFGPQDYAVISYRA